MLSQLRIPIFKIQISQFGWTDYWSKLQTGFTAGTAPDVFTDHLAYFPTFVAKGQVMNIQPLVDSGTMVDRASTYLALADLLARDGKRYGLQRTGH